MTSQSVTEETILNKIEQINSIGDNSLQTLGRVKDNMTKLIGKIVQLEQMRADADDSVQKAREIQNKMNQLQSEKDDFQSRLRAYTEEAQPGERSEELKRLYNAAAAEALEKVKEEVEGFRTDESDEEQNIETYANRLAREINAYKDLALKRLELINNGIKKGDTTIADALGDALPTDVEQVEKNKRVLEEYLDMTIEGELEGVEQDNAQKKLIKRLVEVQQKYIDAENKTRDLETSGKTTLGEREEKLKKINDELEITQKKANAIQELAVELEKMTNNVDDTTIMSTRLVEWIGLTWDLQLTEDGKQQYPTLNKKVEEESKLENATKKALEQVDMPDAMKTVLGDDLPKFAPRERIRKGMMGRQTIPPRIKFGNKTPDMSNLMLRAPGSKEQFLKWRGRLLNQINFNMAIELTNENTANLTDRVEIILNDDNKSATIIIKDDNASNVISSVMIKALWKKMQQEYNLQEYNLQDYTLEDAEPGAAVGGGHSYFMSGGTKLKFTIKKNDEGEFDDNDKQNISNLDLKKQMNNFLVNIAEASKNTEHASSDAVKDYLDSPNETNATNLLTTNIELFNEPKKRGVAKLELAPQALRSLGPLTSRGNASASMTAAIPLSSTAAAAAAGQVKSVLQKPSHVPRSLINKKFTAAHQGAPPPPPVQDPIPVLSPVYEEPQSFGLSPFGASPPPPPVEVLNPPPVGNPTPEQSPPPVRMTSITAANFKPKPKSETGKGGGGKKTQRKRRHKKSKTLKAIVKKKPKKQKKPKRRLAKRKSKRTFRKQRKRIQKTMKA